MSFASSLLAYTRLENPGMADTLPYLTGFLVVLVTLCVLLGLCVLIGKVLQQVIPEPVASKAIVPKPTIKPAAVTSTDDDIPDEVVALIAAAASAVHDSVPAEIVAVIAAATATVVGQTHRVISIKPHNSTWSQAGRQQLHTSHNIR